MIKSVKIENGHCGTPYADGDMTWRELADFINNHMPECNKDDKVIVWNSGEDGEYGAMDGGKFSDCVGITPYNTYEESSADNFYAIDFNGENSWW